jgi:hypothetical protein
MAKRRWLLRVWITSFLVVVTAIGLVLAQPRGRTALRLRPGFKPLAADPRVFFESGAESLATQIASVLLDTVTQVEHAHGRLFRPGYRVYVCGSHESFTGYMGESSASQARGIAFPRDVWISPKAFDFFGLDTHRQTLAHELSHLHLSQHLSWWRRVRTIPPWFAEGLADMIADTGYERVSREDALEALRTGHCFTPDSSGKLPRPRTPKEYGVSWPLFHGQSRLFVEYLYAQDQQRFNDFINAVLDGDLFAEVFEIHLGGSVEVKWNEFLASLE